ncbi:MAG: PTS transporter subunit EIIA [Spirochaetales bacterium]|nr:PTS transporter subunit EIIA [Spirochaetales bacterium]
MTVDSFLAPERCVFLERTEKQEVITELVAALWRSQPHLEYSSIFEAIWEREVQFTTRISPEIAMPHAQIPGMSQTYICAGLSKTGVVYDPKDESLVRLVFLVVGPPDHHLKVLSTLARYLSSEGILQALMESPDPANFYHRLIDAPAGTNLNSYAPLSAPSSTDPQILESIEYEAQLLGLEEDQHKSYQFARTLSGSKPSQNRIVLESALRIALSLEASTLFIHTREPETIQTWYRRTRQTETRDIRDYPPDYLDTLDEGSFTQSYPDLVLVESEPLFEIEDSKKSEFPWLHHLNLPYRQHTKASPVNLALLLALSKSIIHKGQRVVNIFQTSGEEYDSIEVTDLDRDFGVFFSMPFHDSSVDTQMEVFMRVLQIATELAAEGREGKPVGTVFVLGDGEQVAQFSQQMVVNPFRGYDEIERNILDPSLTETLKEFSRIDGAIVIKGNGTIVSAGTYLRVDRPVEPLPAGLGARHTAAAGITAVSRAISLAISESTRQVSIFYGGSRVMVL